MLYVNPLESGINLATGSVPESTAQRARAFEELERLLVFSLLKEMRKTTEIRDGSSDSNEQTTFKEMLDDALSGAMAKSGQFGVARAMEQQFAARQQSAQPTTGK